ncbi:MAG: hypothetical protein ACYDCQ_22770 [Dehalococcoidia bacterium]
MRRIQIALALGSVLFAGALLGAAPPAGASADGSQHIGPIAGATQDGGTCGNAWANDTYSLFFTVHDNGDGTFAVRTEYKDGTFVTNSGASPGACETTNHHGSTLVGGVTGNFQGWIDGTVTSSTYNPNACSSSTCTSRTQAIAAIFGCPGAACYNIMTYNFEYHSSDRSLQYRSWHENFNKNSTTEQDIGDIANS